MDTSEDHTAEVVPNDYSYVFNPYREPIAQVNPGERVTIHTDDAFESRITKKILRVAPLLRPSSSIPRRDPSM
jgi:acetamidase/formamidase